MRLLPPIFLGLFVTAGLYKQTAIGSASPVDLTVLLAVLTGVCVVVRWPRRSPMTDRLLMQALVPWAFFTIGFASTTTGEGWNKVLQAFTLGLLAAIAPLAIVASRREMAALLWTLTATSCALGLLVISGNAQVTSDDFGRVTAFSLNAISTGRALAFGLIWMTLLVATRRLPVIVALAPAGLAAILVGTGARGPLLGTAVAVLVALAVKSTGAAVLRRMLALGVVVVALYVGYLYAPAASHDRIFEVGTSGAERLRYYAASLDIMQSHPLGVGWGNWQSAVGFTVASEDAYPHNLVLEVASEASLLAAAALIWFFFRIARSAVRGGGDLYGQAALALLAFSTINIMVSDDLLGARFWFMICGLVLAREAWVNADVGSADEPIADEAGASGRHVRATPHAPGATTRRRLGEVSPT